MGMNLVLLYITVCMLLEVGMERWSFAMLMLSHLRYSLRHMSHLTHTCLVWLTSKSHAVCLLSAALTNTPLQVWGVRQAVCWRGLLDASCSEWLHHCLPARLLPVSAQQCHEEAMLWTGSYLHRLSLQATGASVFQWLLLASALDVQTHLPGSRYCTEPIVRHCQVTCCHGSEPSSCLQTCSGQYST